MAKAAKLFVLAEFVYNIAIPAARSRRMISRVDPDKVPAEAQADYVAYQGYLVCFCGGIFLALIYPRVVILLAAVALCAYCYSRVEKSYPLLAESLAPFFPSGQDGRPLAERWAEIAAEDETAQAEVQREEKTSGSGPWVVYIIDADGVEKRLPRRFETDSTAQNYADLQRVISRGKITHSGVTYAPES